MKKQRSIEKYLDKVLSIKEGTESFPCSERSFYRWLKKEREKGLPGLVHGLKGKASNHNEDTSKYGTSKQIVKKPLYQGFGPTLMSEHLERFLNRDK